MCPIKIMSSLMSNNKSSSVFCQGNDLTEDFSCMIRGAIPDEPAALSFQEYPDGPKEPNSGSCLQIRRRSLLCNLEAHSHQPRSLHKSFVHAATNEPEAPTSKRQSMLSLKKNKPSLPSHVLSGYAGPQPTAADGRPLRSCVKKPTSSDVQRNSGRRVSFDHVDLREYRRIAGDNPSVSDGCPLAIGWDYNCRGKVDVDSYEADRAGRADRVEAAQYGTRGLPSIVREAILRAIAGVSRTEIAQAKRQAYVHKCHRLETLDQIGGVQNCQFVGPLERLAMLKESAARKLERAKKGCVSSSQEQLKLWEDAQKAAIQRKLCEDLQPKEKRRWSC